jgi:hypothetical protein
MGLRKYIEKIINTYEPVFQDKPKEVSSPQGKNDHPELEVSDLLDDNGIRMYQSIIGVLQWAVS